MGLVLGGIFIILGLVALFYALDIFGERETEAQARLREMTTPVEQVEAGTSLNKATSQGFGYRFSPQSLIDRTERDYMLAGRPDNTSVAKILGTKLILAIAGLALGFMLKGSNEGFLGWVFLLGLPAAGYFVPSVLLSGKARARQEQIQYALPDLLDQITISIESGASFENALTRSGQTGTGPLADELVRTIQDTALGVPRREAYELLVARTDVDELRKFVRAITQGEEFGVPMSDIVRDQAGEMRVTRRLRAEAKANQVPVKMLFPLIATILPVLFMVVIGPAVINAMEVMG